MGELESQIDALYALPLAEFTAARNALAKSLKGDAAAVLRVKQLAKPAQVPWAVNLLYRKERRTWDRLLSAGQTVRRAQLTALEGGTSDIRTATTDHRTALSDAVGTATQLAAQAGAAPPAEPLSRMLEALSLAPEPAANTGRFTELIEPAGFEALAGVASILQMAALATATPPRGAAMERPHPAARPDPASEEARRREADAHQRRAAAAVDTARQQVERAVASAALAQTQVESATHQLERARFALAAARETEARLRGDLERAEATLAALPPPRGR